MADISAVAVELAREFGPNPQQVGATDGTEDEWGELLVAAAMELELQPEHMPEAEWHHFQDVANACQSTTWPEWVAHMQAAVRPR